VRCADFERELRRVNLITRHTDWSETASINEAKLDLDRLYRSHPPEIQQAIKAARRKEGTVGQV